MDIYTTANVRYTWTVFTVRKNMYVKGWIVFRTVDFWFIRSCLLKVPSECKIWGTGWLKNMILLGWWCCCWCSDHSYGWGWVWNNVDNRRKYVFQHVNKSLQFYLIHTIWTTEKNFVRTVWQQALANLTCHTLTGFVIKHFDTLTFIVQNEYNSFNL